MNRPNKEDYKFKSIKFATTRDYDDVSYVCDLEKYCDELEEKQNKYSWHDLRKDPNGNILMNLKINKS